MTNEEVIFDEILEDLELCFPHLSDDELEDYADDLATANYLIERVIESIQQSYDDLYEATGRRSDKEKTTPKLVWRLCNKGKGNEIRLGFDPRTFDSIGKYAGTNDGGGTVVAGPDNAKAWYGTRRVKSINRFNKEGKKQHDEDNLTTARKDAEDIEKQKASRNRRLSQLAKDETADKGERERAQRELDDIQARRKAKKVTDRAWKRALAKHHGVDEKDVSNATERPSGYRAKTDDDFYND